MRQRRGCRPTAAAAIGIASTHPPPHPVGQQGGHDVGAAVHRRRHQRRGSLGCRGGTGVGVGTGGRGGSAKRLSPTGRCFKRNWGIFWEQLQARQGTSRGHMAALLTGVHHVDARRPRRHVVRPCRASHLQQHLKGLVCAARKGGQVDGDAMRYMRAGSIGCMGRQAGSRPRRWRQQRQKATPPAHPPPHSLAHAQEPCVKAASMAASICCRSAAGRRAAGSAPRAAPLPPVRPPTCCTAASCGAGAMPRCRRGRRCRRKGSVKAGLQPALRPLDPFQPQRHRIGRPASWLCKLNPS